MKPSLHPHQIILSLLGLLGLLVLLCVEPASGSGCRIAMRLDDIQDYYTVSDQIKVIDRFIAADIPISVGIIANYFGTDPTIVSYIQNVTTNYQVEACSHNWNHVDISQYNLTDQISMLQNSSAKITSLLPGIPPVITFISPYNSWNSDTLTALADTGYDRFSSSYGLDPGPLSNTAPIYHYPATAATTDWVNITSGVTAATTISQLQSGLSTYGFGVVMVHPELYYADSSWYSELDNLIAAVRTLGCEMSLFRDMNLPSTTTPATTPATTTPATTTPATTPATTTPSVTTTIPLTTITYPITTPSPTTITPVPTTTLLSTTTHLLTTIPSSTTTPTTPTTSTTPTTPTPTPPTTPTPTTPTPTTPTPTTPTPTTPTTKIPVSTVNSSNSPPSHSDKSTASSNLIHSWITVVIGFYSFVILI
jgi:peptidoglycan/xylan/chitin deacetylase (PgdA/CDA1 family)